MALLLLGFAVNLAAPAIPKLSHFLDENAHLSFAFFFLLVLLVLEVVGEGDGTAVDQTRFLTHYSEMKPDLASAFNTGRVELDIAAYTSETFFHLMNEFLRAAAQGGTILRELQVRLLVPDYGPWMTLPSNAETGQQDERYKQSRIVEIHQRHIELFTECIHLIRQRLPGSEGEQIRFAWRKHRMLPLFKFIMINRAKGFFSLYPISKALYEDQEFWDLRGGEASYVGMSNSGTRAERKMLEFCQNWFDTVWENLTVEKHQI